MNQYLKAAYAEIDRTKKQKEECGHERGIMDFCRFCGADLMANGQRVQMMQKGRA